MYTQVFHVCSSTTGNLSSLHAMKLLSGHAQSPGIRGGQRGEIWGGGGLESLLHIHLRPTGHEFSDINVDKSETEWGLGRLCGINKGN